MASVRHTNAAGLALLIVLYTLQLGASTEIPNDSPAIAVAPISHLSGSRERSVYAFDGLASFPRKRGVPGVMRSATRAGRSRRCGVRPAGETLAEIGFGMRTILPRSKRPK